MVFGLLTARGKIIVKQVYGTQWKMKIMAKPCGEICYFLLILGFNIKTTKLE